MYNTGQQSVTSSRLVVYNMYKQGYKEGNRERGKHEKEFRLV